MNAKTPWTRPYKSVYDEKRTDELGEFRIKVLDFARAYTGAEVQPPPGVRQFGWILFLGDPNDPTVGSEASPMLAVSRAEGVRGALVRPLNPAAAGEEERKCAGCGSVEELEPCGGCGAATCQACFEEHGGCGKCMSNADRTVQLTSELLTSLEGARAVAELRFESPLSYVPPTRDEEEARLSAFEKSGD